MLGAATAGVARVDGDVVCMGGTLSEDPGASVGGQRVTAMGVRGLRGVRGGIPRHPRWEHEGRDGHVAASLTWLFIMLLVAWGLSHMAPGRTTA